MNEFKGKLHETAVKFPETDIWIDSCGEEELEYGLSRGCVGATSNPIIVGAVVENELPYWKPRIKQIIADNPSFSEDDVVWRLIDEVGAERSKKLLSVFEQYKGKKGRLSIQTNAKFYRDTDRMVEQAIHLNSLGRNMQVKMPTSAAGIRAMEEATYHGISINATVSFTVAQAVAVAEAVERGIARRKAQGMPCDEMSPVCTIMIGRTDDWLKAYTAKIGQVVDPECLEWAGVAVLKEAYRIFKERGYTTRLLSAANRNHYHWSQFIGGDLCQTINYSWQKLLNNCEVEVVSRIDEPVCDKIMNELCKISEFHKSFDEKAMTPEEFENYGGFRNTLSGFLDGYDSLVKVIRGLMI